MVRVIVAAAGVLVLAGCGNPGTTPAGDPSSFPPPPPPTTTASESPVPAPAPPTLSTTQSPPATTQSQPATSQTATLRATTDGTASVTYIEGGVEQQEEISGSWERTVVLTDPPTTLSVTVESTSGRSSVGCQIRAEGVFIRNNSSGAPSTARCNATIS